MMSARSLAGAGAIVVALGLTSCTATHQAPLPTTSAEIPASSAPQSATATVTTPAAATPTAESGPPALADLTLSTDGLSYVRIGEPVPTVATNARFVRWDENACGATAETGLSGWNSVYDDSTAMIGVFPEFGDDLRDETSPIGTIEVRTAEIRTAHGLGVGSTIADLQKFGAKKGERWSDGSGWAFDPWVVTGLNGELVFWVWEGEKANAGDVDYVIGQVGFELVQETGTEPYFPYELDNCS